MVVVVHAGIRQLAEVKGRDSAAGEHSTAHHSAWSNCKYCWLAPSQWVSAPKPTALLYVSDNANRTYKVLEAWSWSQNFGQGQRGGARPEGEGAVAMWLM